MLWNHWRALNASTVGQVRDEYRMDFDQGRGGYGQVPARLMSVWLSASHAKLCGVDFTPCNTHAMRTILSMYILFILHLCIDRSSGRSWRCGVRPSSTSSSSMGRGRTCRAAAAHQRPSAKRSSRQNRSLWGGNGIQTMRMIETLPGSFLVDILRCRRSTVDHS